MEAKDLSELYQSPFKMENPNERMTIHSGIFILRKANDPTLEFSVNGTIELKWSPGVKIVFNGEARGSDSFEFFKWYSDSNAFDILVNGFNIGSCFITSYGNERSDRKEVLIDISGMFSTKVVLGNSNEKVNEIRFVIPNIKKIPGNHVRHGTKKLMNRINLVSDGLGIIIDFLPDHDDLLGKLKHEGGYIFLASGILTYERPINIEEARDTLLCFSRFLTFLNGRRSSPFCRQGYMDGKIQWTDFTNYHVDIHDSSPSVASNGNFIDLGILWTGFRRLWLEENDLIRNSVHWFVEANNNAIFIEGSIILSQTNLELLFNWLIVETRKVIIGPDGEKMAAANKIRVLLSIINLSPEIPEGCVHIKKYLQSSGSNQQGDGPEIITTIRNALVHSKKVKRDKLRKIEGLARHETLQLSLWYVERVLLYVMDYKGSYYNRISKKVETID